MTESSTGPGVYIGAGVGVAAVLALAILFLVILILCLKRRYQRMVNITTIKRYVIMLNFSVCDVNYIGMHGQQGGGGGGGGGGGVEQANFDPVNKKLLS